MTIKASILVLANRTALSAGLEEALRARAEAAPTMFTLLIPIGRSAEAQQRAEDLAAQLSQAGLEVKGMAGPSDPLRAVVEIYSPAEFDEIIVSTLPAEASPWMSASVPHQIERHTGALVRHVEAREIPAARSHAEPEWARARAARPRARTRS
jgi:hypothetical protein